MKVKHVFRKNTQTPAERSREKAVRDRFQRDKPSLDDLLAEGDCRPEDVMAMEDYFAITQTLAQLRKARQKTQLSLADVSRRSGIRQRPPEQTGDRQAAQPDPLDPDALCARARQDARVLAPQRTDRRQRSGSQNQA